MRVRHTCGYWTTGKAFEHFTIEPTNIDSAIIEVPPTNVCSHASSSRRNPTFGESSYQGTVYVNEDEGERRDPDFVPSDIPDTSNEGDLETSGGEVGGGNDLLDERLAAIYDQIDMEAQANLEFPKDVPPSMDNMLFVGAMFDSKDAPSGRENVLHTTAQELHGVQVKGHFHVIETPDIHVSAIIDRICVMFNTTVKYNKAWRTKHKALARAFGNWDRSYAIMPRWLEAARHFNPGSVVHEQRKSIEWKEPPDFKAYFVTQSTIIDTQLRVGRLFSEKVTEDLERLTDLASGLRVKNYDL
ncbi:uncharacterized protein G2W53_039483 [Senna tora]|uniref:Uncharacterized protein n=1 Tax=Senna tora TaxID=362788 RepID=A0A834W2V2_9FABA|nr:uncharacterized protein G2W53_039483 [Senna tora]